MNQTTIICQLKLKTQRTAGACLWFVLLPLLKLVSYYSVSILLLLYFISGIESSSLIINVCFAIKYGGILVWWSFAVVAKAFLIQSQTSAMSRVSWTISWHTHLKSFDGHGIFAV